MKKFIIDRYNKGQDNKTASISVDHVGMDIHLQWMDGETRVFTHITLYDFLFNPKWGWLDTFHKDPDWTTEFFQWFNDNHHYIYNYLETSFGDNIPNELLTGYILEFMQEIMK